MVFASPTGGISGVVTPWSSARVLFYDLIVHILQSVLTITINNCQYLVSLSRKYFLFVIVERTSEQDCFSLLISYDFDRRLAHVNCVRVLHPFDQLNQFVYGKISLYVIIKMN